MKRLLTFFLLLGLIAYIGFPAIERNSLNHPVSEKKNPFVGIQQAWNNQFLPGIQQLASQLQIPLQNLQFSQLMQQISQDVQMLPGVQNANQNVPVDQRLQVKAGDSNVSVRTVADVQKEINQYSIPTLEKSVTNPFQTNVEIVLFSQPATYRHALISAGVDVKNAHLMMQETGGVAFGNTVFIPLYQTNSQVEMVNILTHELTHVSIQQLGIANQLPIWLNEGLAWQEGFNAEQLADPFEVRMQQKEIAQSIRTAYQENRLLPLSADEQDILHANYNVEYQDYLAVTYLEQRFGSAKFDQFLNRLHQSKWEALLHSDPTNSYKQTYQTFESVFGVSFQMFEKDFLQNLTK
ncbi:hypothetical protein LSG31_03465 [Fodinisporobacter ferrooxydans]|uniref:Peptidase MA-like domain-containing protein n=1 Tax=Fodinisporobacter ferrooxydans TaxID=2901836 RepID=A0ABY4CLM8_9BACL|nr:hypothetical protein LSG31_03465 [Alicyclobacillaceae bacterium MYW30-H2]